MITHKGEVLGSGFCICRLSLVLRCRLFEMEVAHETELQRRYDSRHKSEGETVDLLRQRIRELEAKVRAPL